MSALERVHGWSGVSQFGLLVAFLITTSAAIAGEAPMLTAMVRSGQLPPLEQRLPADAMRVPVEERIGEYGGDWHSALLGGGDSPWLMRTMAYENLMRWQPDWSGILPNVARYVDVNKDATIFTFHLRRGMKWSDGQPFTARDIQFWHDDLLDNEKFTPRPTEPFINADGTTVGFRMLDETTFEFIFKESQGLFLQYLAMARPTDRAAISYPFHYLRQFHPKYNPDVEQLVAQAKLSDWTSLLANKANMFANRDLPTLNAWVVTHGYGKGSATQVKAERNPFYWKIDPEGNQLPYIDSLSLDVISDSQILVAKTLAGEIDFQDRHLAVPANKPVLYDGRQQGGYCFFEETSTDPNVMALLFNLNYRDSTMRTIFQSKDFRIGLSYAINRQELIDAIWLTQGEPAQIAPLPDSIYYNDRLAKQFTEHDIAKANHYLDKVLPSRGKDGFRTLPDGTPFVFTVTYSSANPEFGDALLLIRRHWAEVGIDMRPTPFDRTLIQGRRDTGDLQAIAWERGGGAGPDVVLDPRWYFPSVRDSYFWAPAWTAWFLGDEPADYQLQPEKPPAAARKQMDLYDQLKASPDPEDRVKLMKQILDIAADQFWNMGIALPDNGYGVRKNNFHNVPETMPASWIYPTPGPTNPEQYYISDRQSFCIASK